MPRRRAPPAEHVHPIVKFFFDLAKDESLDDIYIATGVRTQTLEAWSRGNRYPNLGKIDKCLKSYGYEIVVRPMEKFD